MTAAGKRNPRNARASVMNGAFGEGVDGSAAPTRSRAAAQRNGSPRIRRLPAHPPISAIAHPVERVWLYLRERFLSHRLLTDYPAVLDAACEAWNALVAETGRLASLTAYPYLTKSELR